MHDVDSHLWLENIHGAEALAWVETQNAASKGKLEADPGFAPLKDRIRAMLDSPESIPFVSKHGAFLYNFWKDATHQRGLWRRTSLESYKTDSPAWETVLDLDELAHIEGKSWVWHDATFRHPDYTRALVFLSDGGTDAHTMREFDLERKAFVDGGFALPEAKSKAVWLDADTLFVGTDVGEGSLTASGYARQVRRLRRGTKLEDAEVVFEGLETDVFAYGLYDERAGRRFVFRAMAFFVSEIHWHDGSGFKKLPKPDSADASFFDDWVLLRLREDWTTANRTYPQGALLVSSCEDAFAGNDTWTILFEPTSTSALVAFVLTQNTIILNVLEHVQNALKRARFADGMWHVTLLEAPANATLHVSAYDEFESDDYWLTVTGFLTPNTLMLGTDEGLEVVKANPTYFDASLFEVKQRFATSSDGTQVPYFQIARKDLETNGMHPTMLYGYGGFEVAQLPFYSPSIGMGWLERGGVYAVANIRGGGEYGPRWHRAALRENRQRAYDDFIAVAEDLIQSGVTSSQHLGIRGGSNGGLLTGVMLTQRPDLFGAVVSTVPLLDMRRYHTLLAGASWVAEYGDPDNPDDWAFISQYSPYQNVKADTKYPPVIFTTSTRDDRVHPGHARKMVARMLEQGHDVLYFENTEGGHAGAANNAQTAYKVALEYTFLWNALTKP
jgi:prolyl oligopeptidase